MLIKIFFGRVFLKDDASVAYFSVGDIFIRNE